VVGGDNAGLGWGRFWGWWWLSTLSAKQSLRVAVQAPAKVASFVPQETAAAYGKKLGGHETLWLCKLGKGRAETQKKKQKKRQHAFG
jgi:hypothetical protein